MPDITLNGRSLDFTDSSNISVKYRANGELITKTAAEIIADSNGEQAQIQAIMGIGAGTAQTIKTGYVYENGIVQDTNGNSFPATHLLGTEIHYTSKVINTNLFNDVTP